ncbi:glycosyltransferase [Leuconostoc gasicomitatum]|uniref:glycosyltransferase n=1 Tax=Leuconostoc gasicomitatum TaxID=115778 RepID=UPI0007449768|nr:glycosyltransferase [Leuconostoc gasicomitatum]CUR63286.1 Putative dTDP-rhamnosyl transferase 2 RfbF2 [Leuconostoc gasicomitatum KG16-1]
MTKVVAGIVTYNPDLNRLKQVIEAIEDQVAEIVIVDNASQKFDEIQDNFQDKTIISFTTNRGIATALNRINQFAIDEEAGWVLTLDQDSVVNKNLVGTYFEYLKQITDYQQTIGAINSQYEVKDVYVKKSSHVEEDLDVITSGLLTNVRALNSGIGYDDNMFIDLVDFDFNYTLNSRGYLVLRAPFVGYQHELGSDVKRVRFFNKYISVINYSTFRIYYQWRNLIYFYRKWHTTKYFLSFSKQTMKRLIYTGNRLSQIGAILRGIWNGSRLHIKRK